MPYLTSTERIRIEIKRRTTREKKEHVRLSVLIMLDEGFTHETIAANAARHRMNLQGAVHVGSSIKAVIHAAETINAQSTIALYRHLLRKHPKSRIVMICDNAPYHRSNLLADWLKAHPRISQKPLPAYLPNLNLIERLWKWIKKKVKATVYYPTFEAFKKEVLDLFARLPDYQQELKSLLTLNFQIIKSSVAC